MIKNHTLKKSFQNAFNGIFYALKTERNMKIHLAAAIAAISLAFLLSFDLLEWAILAIAIGLVFIAELFNTSIESAVDMVCCDKYNEFAKKSKDASAGATLVAAIISLILGCILFLPKLLQIIF